MVLLEQYNKKYALPNDIRVVNWNALYILT